MYNRKRQKETLLSLTYFNQAISILCFFKRTFSFENIAFSQGMQSRLMVHNPNITKCSVSNLISKVMPLGDVEGEHTLKKGIYICVCVFINLIIL